MMTSVEYSLDLPAQRLLLQIAVELLVFDTAALKSDYFVLQKNNNEFFLFCFTLLTILILHLYTFTIAFHCSYSHCLYKQTGRTHYTTYNINTILTFTLHYSFFYYYLVNFISLEKKKNLNLLFFLIK